MGRMGLAAISFGLCSVLVKFVLVNPYPFLVPIERGRTTTFDQRSSARGRAHLFVGPCCRRLRFGGEGLGAFLSCLLRPFGTTLGWLGQKLDRIGATGDMVYRLRVRHWRHPGVLASQAKKLTWESFYMFQTALTAHLQPTSGLSNDKTLQSAGSPGIDSRIFRFGRSDGGVPGRVRG